MAFDELELKRIELTVGVFCAKRSPGHLKDKLSLVYAVKGHEVVISERRPRWDNQTEWTDTPVAKLKFIRSANTWRLYWMRADMKWHAYPGLSSSNHLNDLVQEIDADPLACFSDERKNHQLSQSIQQCWFARLASHWLFRDSRQRSLHPGLR